MIVCVTKNVYQMFSLCGSVWKMVFCKSGFFSLSPKHFVFAFPFIFGDVHITSHDSIDGHHENDGYLLTFKFGEGLLPCLHHLNLVDFVFEHCDVKKNLGWRFH